MTDQPVIVTGSGGYVGRHVVTALLDRGHEVTAVVRPGSRRAVDSRADVREADILAPEFDAAEFLSGGKPGPLIHLAWQNGFSHNDPNHMLNLSAHFRFVTDMVALGSPRVLALGTMHEVGYWEGAIDADTPTNPLSLYGIAKEALRRGLLQQVAETTSFAWLRCYYIYGDDRNNQSIFTRLLNAADEGRTSFPFTTGQNAYDFIRVEELGHQIAALVDAPDVTGVINCATGEPMTLAAKVEQFIAENNLALTLEYGAFPDRPYDSPGVWGDATVIREVMQRA